MMWGMLASFDDAAALARAALRLREAGYRRFDTYTPYQLDELADIPGTPRTHIAFVVFAAAFLGAIGGYVMQWYLMVVSYPINVGGRPLHSWPAFVPITFELMVLTASIAGVVALLAGNGLPRLHHPLFGVPGFERASQDGFLLGVEAADPMFSPQGTRRTLERLGAREIHEVADA
jgi:Alternative complex III, ActD subunit